MQDVGNLTWWSTTETTQDFWEPLVIQMVFLIPSFFGCMILVIFLLNNVAELEKYLVTIIYPAIVCFLCSVPVTGFYLYIFLSFLFGKPPKWRIFICSSFRHLEAICFTVVMLTPTVVAMLRFATIHTRLNIKPRHTIFAYSICWPIIIAELYILLMGPIQGPTTICGYSIYVTNVPWITVFFFMYRFVGTLTGLVLNIWMAAKLHKKVKQRRGSEASAWTVNEMKLAQSMFCQTVIPMTLSFMFMIEAATKEIVGFNAIYSRIAHTLPYTVYFLTAFLPAVFLERIRNAMIPHALKDRLSGCKTSNAFLS